MQIPISKIEYKTQKIIDKPCNNCNWELYRIPPKVNRIDLKRFSFYRWIIFDPDHELFGSIFLNHVVFYSVGDTDVAKILSVLNGSTVIRESQNTLRFLFLVMIWTQGYMETSIQNALLNANIPKRYCSLPKNTGDFLYRTMYFSSKSMKRFEKQGVIKLRPRLLTSWTIDRQVALKFGRDAPSYAESKQILISLPKSEANVVVNLRHPDFKYLNHYWDQKEVLLKGNGLNSNDISLNNPNVQIILSRN